MEPLIAQFVGDLNGVLDKYRDQGLTNAEAIGGLEIVKMSAYVEATKQQRDDWGKPNEPEEP